MIYPKGFHYFEDAISESDEAELASVYSEAGFPTLCDARSGIEKRNVRFGIDYGPVGGNHHQVKPLPPEANFVRDKATTTAGLQGKDFVASVVSQYTTGATIGWHSDMTMFGPVYSGFPSPAPAFSNYDPKLIGRKS